MKLPRDVDGDELARRLSSCYGYCIDHHTGSHQRLSAVISGKTHSITIPRHKPLRVGTLHGILKDIAEHQRSSLEQVVVELFG